MGSLMLANLANLRDMTTDPSRESGALERGLIVLGERTRVEIALEVLEGERVLKDVDGGWMRRS